MCVPMIDVTVVNQSVGERTEAVCRNIIGVKWRRLLLKLNNVDSHRPGIMGLK